MEATQATDTWPTGDSRDEPSAVCISNPSTFSGNKVFDLPRLTLARASLYQKPGESISKDNTRNGQTNLG